MSIETFKSKLSKRIIYSNVILILLVVILFPLKAFDFEEFSGIVSTLSAVTAIYFGTLFQYLGEEKKNEKVEQNEKIKTKKQKLLTTLVTVHFIILIVLIIMKALALINYQYLVLLIGFIETSFGGVLGKSISAIYSKNEN